MIAKPFLDRREAGQALAKHLERYANRPDVLVLALPRGGVPIGYEIATALNVPLDLFLVRKLGVPGHEELAMGAIAMGGVRVLNEDVMRSLRMPPNIVDVVAEREQRELERRARLYRGTRAMPEVKGQTVILVDDGLATGATMRAAVAALKQLQPARIVMAVPTGSRDTCEAFCQLVDEVLCLLTPEPFQAVGLWYKDFSQTTDEEVQRLLAESHREQQR